ncbi:MAG: transglutaminaseTgpA domain-containing protein [Planctomycetaceae bacterium]
MDNLRLVLNVSIAVLVSVAAVIFAFAEGKSGIPALPIIFAVLGFFMVDFYKTWRVPQWSLSLLGLVAFGAAVAEFFLSGIEAPLLAGGHLLSYLTCVYLLQAKQGRIIWSLCALSLMQVALASLLTFDAWFGLAMPLMLLLTLWTLSVFHLTSAAEESHEFSTGTVGRPALAGAVRAAPHARCASSAMTGSTQLDGAESWVSRWFFVNVLGGTALSLLLAGAFFVLTPRVWIGKGPVFFDGGRPIGGAPARTGFTTNISLGHVGDVQESTRLALEASLEDADTHEQISWEEWARDRRSGSLPRHRAGTVSRRILEPLGRCQLSRVQFHRGVPTWRNEGDPAAENSQ